VAATAFAFAVQSWAQTHLSATTASVVFTSEPVFAALVAWAVGEPIGPAVVLGGALVVASMLVLCLGRPSGRRVGPAIVAGGARRIPAPPTDAAAASLLQGQKVVQHGLYGADDDRQVALAFE
jgi:hypothetical protein